MTNATDQDPTATGPSSEAAWASLVPEGWEEQAAALTQTLSEAVAASLGAEVRLRLGQTQTIATEALTEVVRPPFLLLGLSLTGSHGGTVALVLSEALAIQMADLSFGADAPENPSGQVDEARGQAIENLIASLAPTVATHLGELSGETADLVVSDRDRFEQGDQLQSYLAPEAGQDGVVQTTIQIEHGETVLGELHALIPAAVLQDLPDDPLDDEPWQEPAPPADQPEAAAEAPEAPDETAGQDDSEPLDEDNEDEADSGETDPVSAADGAGEDDDDSHTGVLRPEEMAALMADGENEVDPEAVAEATEDPGKGDEEEEAPEEDVPPDQVVDMHAVHTTLLQASYHIDEELKAFFGEPLELYDYVGRVITKRELLKRFQGKIVVTNMAISGDTYGEAFTAVALDDAIFLGATLIMLPNEEINRKIRNGHFREDESDAFGEVINIFAGAYSAAFGDYFPKNLRLKKDRMTTVAPTKLDVTADEPFPDGEYFLATYSIRLGSRPLQEFHLFFPPKLLGISNQNAKELKEKPVAAAPDAADGPGFATIQIAGEETGKPAIAILADDAKQFAAINEFLGDQNVDICQAKLRDNLREKFRPYDILGVFLIMKRINENSLASLIKIRSLLKGRCPIVVAAPKWDRSMVIKAVSYGAKDIIVTPTDKETVAAKAKQHMLA